MAEIYTTGEYLASNPTWHSEDSPWKAAHIASMLRASGLQLQTIAEIGCGAGGVIGALSEDPHLAAEFHGFDISPQAIELAKAAARPGVQYHCRDPLVDDKTFDLSLVIDVFEHVPDYMGFLNSCRRAANYKIYHIPLDLHVSALLRNSFLQSRESIGHLHYFTADSALAALRDTGHEVLEARYLSAGIELFGVHPTLRRAVANGPRYLLSRLSVPLAARLFGGWSLLVLTR